MIISYHITNVEIMILSTPHCGLMPEDVDHFIMVQNFKLSDG